MGKETLTMSEVKAASSSKEIQKRTDDKGDDNGEGLFTRGRQQNRDSKNQKHKGKGKSRSQSNSRGTTGKKCYFCKKEGHFRDECLALKAKLKKEGNNNKKSGEADFVSDADSGYESADVLVASNVDSGQEWVLDSGCTFHMCPNKDLFYEFEEKVGGTVLLGDNKSCTIEGIGSVMFKLHDGVKRKVQNVRYVPELKRNLL